MFELSSDGTALTYRLTVNRIGAVTVAEIRLSTNGGDGPVVASLYSAAADEKGKASGSVSFRGVITAETLRGPLAGRPLSDLLNSIQRGTAYVSISTETVPAGEIGGWIR